MNTRPTQLRASAPQWSARRPVVIGLFVLITLLGGFVSWATMTVLSGAIIAPGDLEVDRNRQVVQHLVGGVVTQIAVKEGDSVQAGDLLIALDDSALRTRLAITEARLFELIARRGRLEAERDGRDTVLFASQLLSRGEQDENIKELIAGQENLFGARVDSMTQEMRQLQRRVLQIQSQIKGIAAQNKSLKAQRSLILQELDGQQTLLDRGLAQASRVLSLQREFARMDGTLGKLAAAQAEAEGQITQIELEIIKLGINRREDAISRLRDLRSQELGLVEERAALLSEIDQLQIRAPVSGVVYGMQVRTLRSVIRPAEPLLFLIPQDRPLIVVALIDPLHIDLVYIGQPVNLRLSSLDQHTTPELRGHVALVSADAFRDDPQGASYYRAEIALDSGELDKLPPGSLLIPGMPVETFILTQDRTPLTYLVKPFTDYFIRAFRES